MLTRMGLLISISICALMGLDTRGAMGSMTQDPTQPQLTVISGQVKFQKRFTRALEQFCHEGSCPESKAYWSLAIESENKEYVLNAILNLGDEGPPQSMEILGLTLKQNSHVKIEGYVIQRSPTDFTLVSVDQISDY